MQAHNLRAALGLALAGCTLAIPAVVIEVIGTAVPSHAAVTAGQARCVWDARTAGNGEGRSFVAFADGTDHARYAYVSHRVTRELIRGAR